MKKFRFNLFLLCVLIFMGIALSSITCAPAGATTRVYAVNISDQPDWGPTGYDRADYYYIPDIDSYYSVSDRQYIYRDGSDWKHAASLPSSYSGYDPYHSYKVVVNQEKPYQNNNSHRAQYHKFKGVKDQRVIRDSREQKYLRYNDHPNHTH